MTFWEIVKAFIVAQGIVWAIGVVVGLLVIVVFEAWSRRGTK